MERVGERRNQRCRVEPGQRNDLFRLPNEPVFYRVGVKSRQLEKYIPLKGLRRTGFFGWSLNIAADNIPMLLREAGVHEVYSLQVSLP